MLLLRKYITYMIILVLQSSFFIPKKTYKSRDRYLAPDPLRGEGRSRPISRVLSWTAIHLRPASPPASSDLPESTAGHSVGFLFGLAPSGVCHRHACCQPRGALLPHLFTLTRTLLRSDPGGILSAALSVGSRPPGITWHPALRSPDFPPAGVPASDRLADSGTQPTSQGAGMKRLMVSITQAGRSLPSISIVMRTTTCTAPLSEVTAVISPPPRSRLPTGTAAGKRTLSQP